MERCLICKILCTNKLCSTHEFEYIYEPKLDGYRRKKRNRGARFSKYKHESNLAKLLEHIYSPDDIVTGFHPNWAISDKQVLLEYDILIKSRAILVEYQGKQHYRYLTFFHNSRSDFNRRKYLDSLKKELADKNDYKLIYFKYNEVINRDSVIAKIKGLE